MNKSLMIDYKEYINKVLGSDSIIIVNGILKFELLFEHSFFYNGNFYFSKRAVVYKEDGKVMFNGMIETVIIYCMLGKIAVFCK